MTTPSIKVSTVFTQERRHCGDEHVNANISPSCLSKVKNREHVLLATNQQPSTRTSRGVARFVSTSLLSNVCGLCSCASSTLDAYLYVMKPKPRDLKDNNDSHTATTRAQH